jgi:Zn-dependent peptidase ImmA (M78 family)/transcriptional regulator with XRE-family HTH domain
MIKNEQQYKLTRAQANKFAAAAAEFATTQDTDFSPLRRKLYEGAMKSQHEDLCQQLEEYEALKQGHVRALKVESFEDLPIALIKARIASGMTQRDLADILQMKEQQVQRYEDTEYAGASFTRLKEVIQALGLNVREELFVSEGVVSRSNLFANLARLGFKKEFVLQKLIPKKIAAYLTSPILEGEEAIRQMVLQAASIISKMLKVDPAQLLGNQQLTLDMGAVYQARFKKASNAKLQKIAPYTIYAQMLALTLLDACRHLESKPIPSTTKEFRKEILDSYGELTFETGLRYAWQLGIPVLPLNDTSHFHGACWRIEGRNVIVLKQKTAFSTRWLFDLLHELRHAAQNPDQQTLDVIETDDDFTREMIGSKDEVDANVFAGQVMLNDRANDLSMQVIKEAGQDMPLFKGKVLKIAAAEGVDAGALANYLAFRLMAEQKVNWWGTAINLQTSGSNHWEAARDEVLQHARFDELPEVERELLMNALH